jgi:hypothetical protein
MENLVQRLNDYKSLREDIKGDELERVKSFVLKYPKEKHAYNNENESAIALALKFNKIEIYKFLIFNGWQLGPHEDASELLTNVDTNDEPLEKKRKIVFDIHRQCAIDSHLKYLLVLGSKCKLVHSTPEKFQQTFHQDIWRSLLYLNEIALVKPLLKVAACSDDLNLIFDFFRDSVNKIDPNKHNGIYGITYSKDSCILIGAKGLLDDKNRSKVCGTLAHELCHFALNLMYNNNSKPYAKNDETKTEEFDKIVEVCEAKKLQEETICRVFNCTSRVWHAELIVRVPHLLAMYNENIKKLASKILWLN